MKTQLLLITILFLGSWVSFAQKTEDVVYLKNGSIIRGTITEMRPDSIVKIEIAGGSLFVFSSREIKMISREETSGHTGKKSLNFSSGSRLSIDGGWLFATSGNNSNKSPFSLHMMFHLHFTPTTALCMGAGIEFLNITQLPVMGELRQYIPGQSYAPYLFVQGGYLFPAGSGDKNINGYNAEAKGKDGFLVNPGIGFLFPLSHNSEISVSISYRYQEFKTGINNYYIPEYRLLEKSNMVNFRIGILLH